MQANKLFFSFAFIGALAFGACASDENPIPTNPGGGLGTGGGGTGDGSGGGTGDGSGGGSGGGDGVVEGQLGFRDCDSSSPKIGQVAELDGLDGYTIEGSAEIIDDCTVRISGLVSPSLGIRLYAYGGQTTANFTGLGSGFFFNPEAFSVDDQSVIATQGDLDIAKDGVRGAGPQVDPFADGNTDFLVQMKPGRDIDQLGALSIWCEPASANFGEGTFQ